MPGVVVHAPRPSVGYLRTWEMLLIDLAGPADWTAVVLLLERADSTICDELFRIMFWLQVGFDWS